MMPTPYQPTDAEMQALGARLFGIEEHEPVPRRQANSDRRTPVASVLSDNTTEGKSNAKN